MKEGKERQLKKYNYIYIDFYFTVFLCTSNSIKCAAPIIMILAVIIFHIIFDKNTSNSLSLSHSCVNIIFAKLTNFPEGVEEDDKKAITCRASLLRHNDNDESRKTSLSKKTCLVDTKFT